MSNFTLSQIILYPAKSLGGIALTEANIEARGLEHDRRWMLTDPSGKFLSQREFPHMALITPTLEADWLTLAATGLTPLRVPLRSDGDLMPVHVWGSFCDAVAVSEEADAWFEAYLGVPCRLMYMPDETRRAVNPKYRAGEGIVSFADGYPILLLGESSLAGLNERLAQSVPMDRFRPNLVVSGSSAHAEDGWTKLRIGDAVFHGVKPCDRCSMTTIDQATGTRNGPEPLQTLATYRLQDQKILFGQNLISDGSGVVRVGDTVEVLEASD
ncbi:MAG: MOSC domain-containing protein [Janthinobacterium lividum]